MSENPQHAFKGDRGPIGDIGVRGDLGPTLSPEERAEIMAMVESARPRPPTNRLPAGFWLGVALLGLFALALLSIPK